MKKTFLAGLQSLFGKNLELRVRLFHVLAITGVIICVIMTAVSLAGGMWASMLINFGAGIVSFLLLIYSAKSGKYRFCYGMTIAVIFFILFPSLFFSGGGYQGGMSFFFVFAVVFTVYMLDGWSVLAVTFAELVFYAVLILITLKRPDLVVPFESDLAVVVDIIIGMVTVSISLGATMYVQVRMYQKQQKELEQAQKAAESANMAKSLFLANMSHEIRTPIHMILGMNEIIHRESRNGPIKDYSEKINDTSKMLLSLVDNVLDVSKIESGKMELIPAAYETDHLVRTLVLIGKTSCRNKNLQFAVHAAENLPPCLYGDLAHIRQIAANFLSNAVKYTAKGNIILSVTWEPCTQEEEILLCISVQDTGIGIPQEALPTLFDAFTRADLAAHRYIEGTGLGLKIVKELTALMGGTVSVESEQGTGSTFSVKIPQKIVEDDPHLRQEQAMTFQAPRVHILAVDDNEGNRMILRELLAPTQICLDTAQSGQECLRMVQENNYDLVLMDYMMPGMDGLETMQRLKKIPGFSVPVIALTADATAETGQKLISGGFSAHLIKPVPWARLRDTLLSFLPEDQVTLLPEGPDNQTKKAQIREMDQMLQPYGLMLEEAMAYFEDSLPQYAAVAEMFLRYDSQEREKVEKLMTEKNWKQLRFSIHAMKGKAANLGMQKLSEACAHVERLCTAGETEEIESLMPYVMYVWGRGKAGLELLKNQLRRPEPEISRPMQDQETCQAQLLRLLKAFRRKPSLDCIAVLLEQEQAPFGREKLLQVKGLVDAISFEQAEDVFKAYLAWKKGEECE